MKIILIGSTGMLGQELYKKFSQKDFEILTISRSNSTNNVDLLIDSKKVTDLITQEKPNIVVNCAAMINLKECEKNVDNAYMLNARLPSIIARACSEINCYFIQISTDHYYENDKNLQHSENDTVVLLNEYARTKYAGEFFALTNNNSLVVRTNIVGFRNKKDEPTFIEWVIKSLVQEQTIVGFEDFYTSSIDIYSFSNILIELIELKYTGIINIGAKDVYSKYDFIYELAKKFGKEGNVVRGKLNDFQEIKRANSLGLDISKLQKVLHKQQVPSSKEVINRLYEKFKEGEFHELS
ncbi:SDR family oxidoreductase [Psychrobacillus sp. FSL W7-1457]|uniref:SDR family oxidoreductase n=1 Tax=unclassified Psychrobacillus TaxID=2636677 RepID=UPI0030FAA4E9